LSDLRDQEFDLPDGMRAMAIRVSILDVVGDFIKTGSRVDVAGQVQRDGISQVETLAQNVLVLAVNTTSEAVRPNGEQSKTITVAVTPAEALALASAMRLGPLSVNLRRPKP
jgi:Flp pilus assembly protein CpaB